MGRRIVYSDAMCNESEDSEVSEEIDIDLTSEESPDRTMAESEFLGSFSSITAYLRAMLEPEVSPACAWILDHLDYRAVQRRWESDGSRLVHEAGHIFRLPERRIEP